MTEILAYLGLGSNLGERKATLQNALDELAACPNLTLTAVSSFYETAPWGKTDQPPFVNAAAKVKFRGTAKELLAVCQAVENKLGRVREVKWGPRTIDIDILHVVGFRLNTPELSLPHPYLTERAFVLVPLTEIASGLLVGERSVEEHLAACPDRSGVKRIFGGLRDFKLSMIACVDKNGGLGYQDKLLFRLPEDMRFFRKETEGQAVIMGARTFASLPDGLPLANRYNIILSRHISAAPKVAVCHSLDELRRTLLKLPPQTKKIVIGGAKTYAALLPYAVELILTEVGSIKEADAFFPPISDDFAKTSQIWKSDPNTGLKFSFCRYIRRVSLANFSQ